VKELLKAFIHNPDLPIDNIHQFQRAAPIDFNDLILELVPEVYLDQAIPNEEEIEEGVEQLVRETVAQIIRTRREENYDR
jgi:hypothetical protein